MLMVFFFAIWRRWFGGGFFRDGILAKRGLQAIIGVLAMLPLFTYESSLYGLILGLIVSVYVYCQFWSRGHGCCFDLGRDKEPSEDTIKRYNERWYHIPCDKLFKKYSFAYDFTYMALRYTGPLLPLLFIDWRYILIGFMISPIYAFCWTLEEYNHEIFEKYPWCQKGTNLAELLSGFTFGVLAVWIRLTY